MTSTSSSSPLSTCHTMRGGTSPLRSSRTFYQRRVHHPWRRRPRCCQVCARRRGTAHRWPATRRRTSERKSTAVEVGKIVVPLLSATARGVEISRVATMRKTSTCLHRWVRAKSHMHRSPLTPREFWVGGAWYWPHTYVWWSDCPSSDPTCQGSTTG
jgi:hypothetical protein